MIIYKGKELNCKQEQLDNFITSLNITSELRTFSEKYNGVTIENPTVNLDAKYYIISVNNQDFLQTNSPFHQGLVECTQEIIDKHKEEIIDNMIISKFGISEDEKKRKELETLKLQVDQQNKAIADLTMMFMMQTPTI